MTMRVKPLPRFSAIVPDTSVRAPGLHVSAIIKDILIAMNRARYGDEVTPTVRRRWEVGFLWEEVLSAALARRHARKSGTLLLQQEIEFEGVFMTPDAVNIRRWLLEEFKATWKSSAHDIQGAEFFHWRIQIMAYLYALGMTKCILRVLFINGDYRGSGPIARAWALRFTPRELAENWMMLSAHARRMAKAAARARKAKAA